jgi:hypothetical protein
MKVLMALSILVSMIGCSSETIDMYRVTKCVSTCEGADEVETRQRMYTNQLKFTQCICTFNDETR